MNICWINKVIEKMSNIGRTSYGGSNRADFSKEDLEARKYFLSLIEEAGLKYRIDGFGNIFARLEGYDKEAPAVATGSHIDTVPNGGHFDGVLGSVSSLAAIKKIQNEGFKHKYPIELMIFQLEESSRFGHSTMGSKVVAGKDISSWASAKDQSGITLPNLLKSVDLDYDKLSLSKRDPKEFKAFIELHVDQSPDLEKAEKPIGIVEAIAAPIRSKVIINGEAAHSGATQMRNRKDALVSAAELILAVRNFGIAYSEKHIVTTVGNINVYPGAMNVVPGKAELFIDLRGIDKDIMDEVYSLIKSESSKIAMRHETPVEIKLLSKETPVKMDRKLILELIGVCKDLYIPCEKIISGAGHDTMNMSSLTPSCMIFVRSKEGISHHPGEFVAEDDIRQGFEVLTEMIKRLSE